MNFTAVQLMGLVDQWLWPFLRVAALIMAAPVLGTRAVPPRIRMILALALCVVVVPVLPPPPVLDPFTAAGLSVGVQQVLIGITIGLAVRLIFTVFDVTGQLLGQQMGLAFASLIDPQNGTQVPVVSQVYVLFTTLLFLALDGHLLLIEAVVDSFALLPVGAAGITQAGAGRLLAFGGEVLAQAVLIAAPVIATLLIANLAFGVMARSTPQLNIFAVGFPLTILVGVAAIWLTLPLIEGQFTGLLDRSLTVAREILNER